MLSIWTIALISYLVGSVSTSVIVARLVGGVDIRDHGSGNAGATNVLRVLGWKPALAVLIVDVAKGFVAAELVSRLRLDATSLEPGALRIVAGSCVIVGHVWPVFARFRGGKGVATAAGVLLALEPLVLIGCVVVFVVVVAVSRIASLASVSAVVLLPGSLAAWRWLAGGTIVDGLLIFSLLLTALILVVHRSNIARLIAGTEPAIGQDPDARGRAGPRPGA